MSANPSGLISIGRINMVGLGLAETLLIDPDIGHEAIHEGPGLSLCRD